MKLVDYIKQCLENEEFKKYWEEDNLPTEFDQEEETEEKEIECKKHQNNIIQEDQ